VRGNQVDEDWIIADVTLPADIRGNTQVPFSALVTGAGRVTIGKANGVRQIGSASRHLARRTSGDQVTATPIVAQTPDQIINCNDRKPTKCLIEWRERRDSNPRPLA
jgi:hypothetical protein